MTTSRQGKAGLAFMTCSLLVLVVSFGWWGYMEVSWSIPIFLALLWFVFRKTIRWWYCVIVLSVALLTLVAFAPPSSGYPRPSTKVVADKNNLKQILTCLERYHEEKGHYPERLSVLVNEDYAPKVNSVLWVSPRGAGQTEIRREGPLRLLLSEYGTLPPPPRIMQSPSDLDDSDYLYLSPAKSGSTEATIILMTRPGLLYRNQLNAGFAGGQVDTLSYREWTDNPQVTRFLTDWMQLRRVNDTNSGLMRSHRGSTLDN